MTTRSTPMTPDTPGTSTTGPCRVPIPRPPAPARPVEHGAAPPHPVATPRRWHGDRGEGVISASIAVLVMAFLGALMWVGFQQMWETTETNTRTQVEQIGR